MSRIRPLLGAVAITSAAALLAGCAGTPEASTDVDAATATSAEAFGGMEGLIAAAKAEGQLNVIALPEDWANYGAILTAFEAKYGITVNSANPNASSAEEIQAAETLKGQDTAPDVFDLGSAVALANTQHFAPYKVATWADIPAEYKEPSGLWVYDYTGVMSVGYDAGAVPEPTSLQDLLGEQYRGKVAINGDPTQAGAAAAAVNLVALLNGGSADDIGPGVDFFVELNKVGNFLPVDPTPATIASGETPVVFDWSYNNLAESKNNEGVRDWRVTVLPGVAVGSYYNQAINVDAPNPAAARLWQEFLYSDEGQNLWLAGGAYPVRLQAMIAAGTVDQAALDALGAPPAELVQFTAEQTEAASKVLADRWSEVLG